MSVKHYQIGDVIRWKGRSVEGPIVAISVCDDCVTYAVDLGGNMRHPVPHVKAELAEPVPELNKGVTIADVEEIAHKWTAQVVNQFVAAVASQKPAPKFKAGDRVVTRAGNHGRIKAITRDTQFSGDGVLHYWIDFDSGDPSPEPNGIVAELLIYEISPRFKVGDHVQHGITRRHGNIVSIGERDGAPIYNVLSQDGSLWYAPEPYLELIPVRSAPKLYTATYRRDDGLYGLQFEAHSQEDAEAHCKALGMTYGGIVA